MSKEQLTASDRDQSTPSASAPAQEQDAPSQEELYACYLEQQRRMSCIGCGEQPQIY